MKIPSILDWKHCKKVLSLLEWLDPVSQGQFLVLRL